VPLIRGRLRRRREGGGQAQPAESDYVEIDTSELSGMFAAPGWLRDIGISAWLLVGITLFVMGVVWLLSLTSTIVIPVIVALIVAAVAEPAVGWFHRHRVPRGVGAALVMLAIVLVGAGVFVMILAGVTGELSTLSSQLQSAASDISGWLKDIGVDSGTADGAKNDAGKTLSDIAPTLLNGVAAGIRELSSLVFFLAMTILSLFFLLADGPKIRGWVEGHLGVPDDVARVVTGRTLGAMRGYFLGVTIVAAYSAVVVGVGALIIGVPLAGTIAIVTFVGGFVPYLGAWTAGAFAVVMALGGGGADAAAAMAVLQLLANGILQQLVQPFAMGTALGIHPLAVLIVTIAGGALFGVVGLILAAPLVSAAVRISADLSKARGEAAEAAPARA
jgi:predicted PurR-regulated permease PerM